MPDLKLLATDLDGTLIGRANELPLYLHFREVLGELRRAHGTVWAACTGRSMGSFRHFFHPMRVMDILPDYVIVNHAHLYRRTAWGWYWPHLRWCVHIEWRMWRMRLRTRGFLRSLSRELRGGSHGVRRVLRDEGRFRLRFESPESAAAAAGLARVRVRDWPNLGVEQALNEIEVHTIPHTKGLAVQELAGHLGLVPAQVLTVGDGLNDLSMLDPRVAAHMGCPANAAWAVKLAVQRGGGHVASEPTLGGVLEVLAAVREGRPRAELPEIPAGVETGALGRRRRRHGGWHRFGRLRRLLLALAALYVTLVVFAHFGLLPGILRRLVLRPVAWLFTVMESLGQVAG